MAPWFHMLRRAFDAACGPKSAALAARLLIAAVLASAFAVPDAARPQGAETFEGLGTGPDAG